MKIAATKRSNATARGFIGEWTRCTRLREQILWLPISRLPWRYLASPPSNSTLTCGYWTICACHANWWLGQKWPCCPLKRPPAKEVRFNTSEEAVTYCQERLRQGWLLDSAAERDPRKRPRLSHPELQKETLFKQQGRSLEKALASGIPELDLALDQVRLDR